MALVTWWLLAAVLLQGVLTLSVMGVLSAERVWLLRHGRVRAQDVRLTRDAWPDIAKQASNTFDSQFQMPVLFYVAAGITVLMGADWIAVALAWVFALSRWGHAAVYIVSNHVPTRATLFSIGYATLIVWWLVLIVRLCLVLGGPGAA